ncbi:MAG: hypothetical protein PHV17_09945 [Candidatus Omnitrophica bacterium]|nr:hypothetical protein [Candidatus Omnitrophota bacterium]
MKILQVIPSLNPVYGGTVESLKQLTAALEKIGHRVEVVTCDDRKSLWLKNLSCLVYPLGKG